MTNRLYQVQVTRDGQPLPHLTLVSAPTPIEATELAIAQERALPINRDAKTFSASSARVIREDEF